MIISIAKMLVASFKPAVGSQIIENSKIIRVENMTGESKPNLCMDVTGLFLLQIHIPVASKV
jgi:hypothetical protein